METTNELEAKIKENASKDNIAMAAGMHKFFMDGCPGMDNDTLSVPIVNIAGIMEYPTFSITNMYDEGDVAMYENKPRVMYKGRWWTPPDHITTPKDMLNWAKRKDQLGTDDE